MDTLQQLVDALRCLPGVGPKSAQRMVYYLLQHKRQSGVHLADCLKEAMITIGQCQRCNTYTDGEYCLLCQNPSRDQKLLCVVENPADIHAIEQSNAFKGLYFVLMGKISPLDGLGPDDLGLEKLEYLVKTQGINEVILALSPTVEGQTTIHFIQASLRNLPTKISQLAQGIPSGGTLEFLDGYTISSAVRNRAFVDD